MKYFLLLDPNKHRLLNNIDAGEYRDLLNKSNLLQHQSENQIDQFFANCFHLMLEHSMHETLEHIDTMTQRLGMKIF